MQHAEHLTPTQMQQFLEAGATLSFAGTGRKPVYALIERTLRGCQYPALSKKDKGIVRRYLAKISGLSRSIRIVQHKMSLKGGRVSNTR